MAPGVSRAILLCRAPRAVSMAWCVFFAASAPRRHHFSLHKIGRGAVVPQSRFSCDHVCEMAGTCKLQRSRNRVSTEPRGSSHAADRLRSATVQKHPHTHTLRELHPYGWGADAPSGAPAVPAEPGPSVVMLDSSQLTISAPPSIRSPVFPRSAKLLISDPNDVQRNA